VPQRRGSHWQKRAADPDQVARLVRQSTARHACDRITIAKDISDWAIGRHLPEDLPEGDPRESASGSAMVLWP